MRTAREQTEKFSVIYVMGAGRSGSTILGLVLGNCSEILYAGELDGWLRRSGEPNFPSAARTAFWRVIYSRMGDSHEHFGERMHHTFEHSLAPLSPWRWPARRRLRASYRRINLRLFEALGAVSGAKQIVDSSHYPLRARELQKIDGLGVFLIYLIRDPRDVVESFAQRHISQPYKPPIATNAYMWLTHLFATFVFLRQPRERRMALRFEELMANPAGVCAELQRRVGSPPPAPDLTRLYSGLAFQGNRLLEAPVNSLECHSPERIGARSRPLTWLLQLPWTALAWALAAAGRVDEQPGSSAVARERLQEG